MASDVIAAGALVCEKTDPMLIPMDKAAEKIGIPKRTLWRFIDGSQVPAVKMGGKWYLAIATINRIVREGVPVAAPSETDDDQAGDTRR